MNKLIYPEQVAGLKAVSVFATLFVVLRHGQNLHIYYNGGSPFMPILDGNVFIQESISRITDCAIPCFFCVSGFLFFLGLNDLNEIAQKLIRRVHSLFIPFIVWNFILLAMVIAAWFILPQIRGQLTFTYGVDWNWQWFLRKFSLNPIVGQFWYIRTLMIFCCFSPLFLYLYKFKIISLLVFGILMLRWEPIDCTIFSSEGLVCFYFGGLIGYQQWHENMRWHRRSWWLLVAVAVLTPISLFLRLPAWAWYFRVILSVMALIQISMYCVSFPRFREIIAALSHYSFFLYASHAFLLGIFALPFRRLGVTSPMFSLMTYCIGVVSTIVFGWGTAWVIARFLPKFYSVLTGGR